MLATLNEPFGRDGYSRLMIALSGLGEHDADGPASRGLEVRALRGVGHAGGVGRRRVHDFTKLLEHH